MQLREMFEEITEKKIVGLGKQIKKMNDRIQAQEEKQQRRSPAGNTGSQEEKSGERVDCAIEACRTLSHGITLSPSQQLKPSMAVSSHIP